MKVNKMQEIFKDNDLCVKCLEPISNPVCIHCYMKEIIYWMKDQEIDPLASSILFTAIERRIQKQIENTTKCVICKKEPITLCSYCFFLIAIRTLNELNFPKEKIESFLETFNYSLGDPDYKF